MPVFLCRWPNGDLSIVNAEDEEEAAARLEETGDAEDPAAILVEFPKFMMHFKLPEKIVEGDDLNALLPPLIFDGFDWDTDEFLAEQFYPSFHEAGKSIDFDADPGTSSEEAFEALNKALAEEKARLWIDHQSPQPHTGPKRLM